jgi:rhomboid family GlyGly-CTERM serine protease
MDAETRLTAMRPPLWTLLICAGAALIFGLPALRPLLIYDRAAIAHGELWRLVTGNLVHLSPAHLCFDLAAFFIAGAIIEVRGYSRFPVLCLTAATFIGIVLYCVEPAMYYYAGLSGVAMAAVAYLCLHGLTEKGAWRWLCAAALVGVTVKLWFELAFGKSLLSEVGAQEFVPMPLSHLVGTITALLLFVLVHFSDAGRGARQQNL